MSLRSSDWLHCRYNRLMMQPSLGFWQFLVLSCLLSVVSSLARAEEGSFHAVPLYSSDPELCRPDPLDTKEICGVNCLYMFLRLHGCDVSFDQTWQALGMKKQGTSLLDLKQASTTLGFETRAIECLSATELSRMPFPLILFRPHPNSEVGHFLLALKVSEDGELTAVDGTTAKSRTYTIAYFREYGVWTGFVLVRSGNGDIPTEFLHLSLVGMFIVFICVARKRVRINTSTAGLLASAILLSHPVSGI